MFNKVGKLFLILAILFISLSPALAITTENAWASAQTGGPEVRDNGDGQGSNDAYTLNEQTYIKQLVQSEGFITNFDTGHRLCIVSFGVDVEVEEIESPNILKDWLGSVLTAVKKGILGIFNWVLEQLEEVSVCNAAESGSNDSTNLGFFSQANVFAQFVNITHLDAIMFLTGIMQRIAITGMILFILVHAYQVLKNGEGNSLKFFARFGIAMFAAYAAPWLIQDILGLNNKLSFMLANQELSLTTAAGDVSVTVGNVFVAMFAVYIQNLIGSADNTATSNIMGFIVNLVIMVAVMFPLFKIVIWWYTRMFKLFVFTVISPIMFAMFGSETTERTGSNFTRNVVTTVFEQFFVLVGMAIAAAFLSEIPKLVTSLGLGHLGTGLAMYAAFSFVAQIPGLVSGMIEGNVGGSPGGIGTLGQGARKTFNGARRATRGAIATVQAGNRYRARNFGRDSDRKEMLQKQNTEWKKNLKYSAMYGKKTNNYRNSNRSKNARSDWKLKKPNDS